MCMSKCAVSNIFRRKFCFLLQAEDFFFGVLDNMHPSGPAITKYARVHQSEVLRLMTCVRTLLPTLYHPQLRKEDGDSRLSLVPVERQTEIITAVSAGIFNLKRYLAIREVLFYYLLLNFMSSVF